MPPIGTTTPTGGSHLRMDRGGFEFELTVTANGPGVDYRDPDAFLEAVHRFAASHAHSLQKKWEMRDR